MFKIGGEIKKLTTSGATNFRSSELVFRNNIVKVNPTMRSYFFEAWFHLFSCAIFTFISSIILNDARSPNPYEVTFWLFAFCLLFSTLVRLGCGLRATVKSFDLELGLFYVANSFKKRSSIPLAEIDKLYLIRFHNSSTNNNYNGYEFSLTTKSDATYLLMNHSDFYSIKNEIKKLAGILGVPFEILVAGDIYEDPILE